LSNTKSIAAARSISVLNVFVGVLLFGPACRTKLNPALDGFSCDDKTGVCVPRDGGSDAIDGSDSDVGADGEGGVDADAGGGQILITAPATSPVYTNGTVAIQVSFASGTTAPAEVELLKNDVRLGLLTAPQFSYSWDTTAEAEGTYALTARAQLGGRSVTSAPVSIVVDRTPPKVVLETRLPAPGATEVALTDPIQVAFSEPIQASSAPMAVVLAQSSGPIATNATLAADAKSLSIAIAERSTVTLTAASPATLSATVSTSVKDLAGNAIVDPPQWSWSVPLWLDFGFVQGESPSLALDSTGAAFLSTAFEPEAIGSQVFNLRVSRHVQGKTWDASYGSPQTANSLILFGSTSVAVGGDGKPLVAWSEQPAGGGGSASIHVARWSGSAWDTTFPALDEVAGSGTNGYSPWLTTGGPNTFFVAWAEVGLSSVTDVHVARWTGSAWNPLPALGVIGASSPALLIGADGQPVVDWVAGSMMAGVSTWNGQAWSTIKYPSTYWSGLALDKTKRPIVAFVDGSSLRVRYIDANAEEYAPAIPGTNQPSTPRLTIDSQNRAVVVWSDLDISVRNVKVARWTGTEWDMTFGSLSAMAAAGTNATSPVVALDASDSPIVAWQEPDPVRKATYVRKSNR
jgi:hypothetical protein